MALVFALEIRNLESNDTSCRVDDIFSYSMVTVGSQNYGKELRTIVLRLISEITVSRAFAHDSDVIQKVIVVRVSYVSQFLFCILMCHIVICQVHSSEKYISIVILLLNI